MSNVKVPAGRGITVDRSPSSSI